MESLILQYEGRLELITDIPSGVMDDVKAFYTDTGYTLVAETTSYADLLKPSILPKTLIRHLRILKGFVQVERMSSKALNAQHLEKEWKGLVQLEQKAAFYLSLLNLPPCAWG